VRAEEVERTVTTTITVTPSDEEIAAMLLAEEEITGIPGVGIEGDVEVAIDPDAEEDENGIEDEDGDILGVGEEDEPEGIAAAARNPFVWLLVVAGILIGWNAYKRQKAKI
jgi:hypothetical protein